LARRLLVAGAFVWVASRAVATGEAKPLPIEVPDDVPEAAVAPAPPRRAFRKRVATSLAFSVLFFAGAAFTAGAGNELASDGTSTDATPAVAAEATVPPPAPEVVTTDEAPVETAPAPAPAVEAAVPTPAPEVVTTVASPVETAPAPVPAIEATSPPPVPDIAATDAPPVDAAPASADPEPVRAVDAQDAVVLPATLAVSPAPVAASLAPVAHHPRSSVAPRHVRHVAAVVSAPAQVPLAPIPFQAIEFNPQAWLHNNPASPTGASVVAIAQHYLDVPYRWGGAVPATGFDCSGLTRFVYAQLGVNLPHYAASQFAAFPKLDPAELQPGDLVFFEPRFDGPGHVAIYIGNDQMIEAPHTGALVRISSFSGAAAQMGFLGAVRPYTTQVEAAPTPLQTPAYLHAE
jgi:cell wall-associated NlpC family hydrolase